MKTKMVVHSACHQHTDVRQQDVNHMCQTGEKTQSLPPEKHLPYPWHIMARQCPTPRSCPEPTFQACSLCSDSAGYIGMEDGRIPKDILYGEFASGRRTKGCPQLCCKDICKRDMKALDIITESWEDLAANCMMWRSTLNQHLKSGEEKLVNAEVGKRACRKERNNSNRPETTHKCDFCGRDCFF